MTFGKWILVGNLALSVTLGFMPQLAHPLNWNGRTATQIFDKRKIEVKSGHPLATLNSFSQAAEIASKDQEAKDAMEMVYGEVILPTEKTYEGSLIDDEGFVFQKVLWGNWLNEVKTTVDGVNDGPAMSLVNKILTIGYGMHKGIFKYFKGEDGEEEKVTIDYNPETTRTTTYDLHSMLITRDPKAKVISHTIYDQTFTMDKIRNYSIQTLKEAIGNLIKISKMKEDAEKNLVFDDPMKTQWKARLIINKLKGFNGTDSGLRSRLDKRFEYALRGIGSLFHIIQDSAVSCTKKQEKRVKKVLIAKIKSKRLKKIKRWKDAYRRTHSTPLSLAEAKRRYNRLKPLDTSKVVGCLPGDGHGIQEVTERGTKVISLSSHSWYLREGAHEAHGNLDDLYQSGQINETYGNFDPAIAGGQILIDVAKAVVEITSNHTDPAHIANGRTVDDLNTLEGLLEVAGLTDNQPLADVAPSWNDSVKDEIHHHATKIAEKYILSRYATNMKMLADPPEQ